MIPYLGQVKGVVRELFGVFFGHDLKIQGPAGKIPLFDMLEQVTLMAVAITADNLLSLGVREISDALLGSEVKLDPEAFVPGIDQAVGMAAETVHVTVGSRNAAVAHDHGNLMQGFGQQGPEVPFVLGAGHIGARVALDHMVQVGKLERIAQKEHRGVIAHHVPVALIRIEFEGKAADVPLRVSAAALGRHSGKTSEDFRFLADLGKERSLGVWGHIMGHGKGSVGA